MDAIYEGFQGKEEEAAQQEALEPAYAGFWIRFWAFLLDWLVIWGLNHLIVSPVFTLMNLPKTSGMFTISVYSVTTRTS